MAKYCSSCNRYKTVELFGTPDCETCRKNCAAFESNTWSTKLRETNTAHALQLSQSKSQIEELQSQIEELQSLLEQLQPKLSFLSLQFDNRNAGVFKTDVEIFVKDNKEDALYAHKYVLANKSTVFYRMLTTEMLERETGIIEIDDATMPIMRAVIKFCYDADIDFNDEVTGAEVLAVAHKYGIELLVRICEEHLIKTIDKANLPRILKLAKMFGTKRLQAGAEQFLKRHFDELIGAVMDDLV